MERAASWAPGALGTGLLCVTLDKSFSLYAYQFAHP